MTRLIPVAIAYDFDGTLAPGNMQELAFIPDIRMTKKAFWKNVEDETKKHDADNILIYMKMMLEKANQAEIPVLKSNIESYGKSLAFFDGVLDYTSEGQTIPGWFKRINNYGKTTGVKVSHYIISSGIKEMVTGCKISNEFDAIFASSFYYDHNGIAIWPALALNYTTKTQYLFRINKGALKVHDDGLINNYVPLEKRKIPFENIIYIGDGVTDIPCFRVVKDKHGHSIAVYKPRGRGAKQKAEALKKEGRVNFIAPADYKDGSSVDKIVKGIIEKIQFDNQLRKLS